VRKPGRPRGVFRNEWFDTPDRSAICLLESDSDFAWAHTAACVLFTLERGGTSEQKRACDKFIGELRQGHREIPSWVSDSEFLERFIEQRAPGWNWRLYIDDGKAKVMLFITSPLTRCAQLVRRNWALPVMRRQMFCQCPAFNPFTAYLRDGTDPANSGCLQSKIRFGSPQSQRNPRLSRREQIAKEQAQMARHHEAWRKRYVTPDQPDIGMLYELRLTIPIDPASWPTLRELKMATAIPERLLEAIIADLRPRTGEIVRVARRRKFSERGAWPKRFAPRIVVGVLKEFAERLRTRPITDYEEPKRIHELTRQVIRSLSAKIARCGRTSYTRLTS
jgi:hypothetical protein